MTVKNIEFAELLCAKICHDLAGPIGAISNGIDFLDTKNDDLRQKSIELVQFSSRQAVSKINFFRQAYGFVPVNSESNFGIVKSLILNLIEGGKISVTFTDDQSIIDGRTAKILLNIFLIISSVIMYNGKVSFELDSESNNKKMAIIGTSPSYKVDNDLVSILKGSSDSIMTTRNVQHYYTYSISKDDDYSIDIAQEDGKVIFNLIKA